MKTRLSHVLLGVVLSVLLVSGMALSASAPYVNIVDTAKGSDQLKTFVATVEAAGLTDVLMKKGPFTVFAPTDEAFAKLPEGKLNRLLQPENKQKLVEILTYHVIPEVSLTVDNFRSGESYKTVNGLMLNVLFQQPPIVINKKINVVSSLACSNGIIYLVDTVILPPETPAKKKSK
ncbi:MAG: fasciclin domain-containing protein [Atribacterota bacterium]|nr:fasciclin domain-containing protein [Candidatus Atribacteria bacterium]